MFTEANGKWYAIFVRKDGSLFSEPVIGWQEDEFGRVIPRIGITGDRILKTADLPGAKFVKFHNKATPTKEHCKIAASMLKRKKK